jgi:hypothetical protein
MRRNQSAFQQGRDKTQQPALEARTLRNKSGLPIEPF